MWIDSTYGWLYSYMSQPTIWAAETAHLRTHGSTPDNQSLVTIYTVSFRWLKLKTTGKRPTLTVTQCSSRKKSGNDRRSGEKLELHSGEFEKKTLMNIQVARSLYSLLLENVPADFQQILKNLQKESPKVRLQVHACGHLFDNKENKWRSDDESRIRTS